ILLLWVVVGARRRRSYPLGHATLPGGGCRSLLFLRGPTIGFRGGSRDLAVGLGRRSRWIELPTASAPPPHPGLELQEARQDCHLILLEQGHHGLRPFLRDRIEELLGELLAHVHLARASLRQEMND